MINTVKKPPKKCVNQPLIKSNDCYLNPMNVLISIMPADLAAVCWMALIPGTFGFRWAQVCNLEVVFK